MTKEYLDRLVNAYPSIREIWLLGSRANGSSRPDSDWDYLVFCDEARAFNDLHQDKQFDDPNIDLLFLGPGLNEATRPWPSPDTWKKLGLGDAPGGIRWEVMSESEARYLEPRPAARTLLRSTSVTSWQS
jgi:hypothetical protein